MHKGIRVAGVGILCAALSGVAHGDTGGFYGGFALGSARADIDEGGIDAELGAVGLLSSTSSDDSDTGVKVFGGYRIGRFLAVEAGYVELGSFTTDSAVSGGNPGTIHSELDLDGWFLGAVGSYPLTERWDVLGKLGGVY